MNCSPSDFREDGEEVGRAAIGDPHLLAVQDVVRAVRAQIGARLRGQSVGAGVRLGQAIRADPFAAGQLRQILAASAPRCRRAAAASVPMPACAPCHAA